MYLEVVAGYWFLQHETAEYANAWRFCGDHHDDWENTVGCVACRKDQGVFPFNLTTGTAGAWPYMDFLMTGGQGCAPYEEGVEGMHCPQQSDAQYATEFSLWSLTQSPLVVSTDVRNLTSIMQQALLNTELLDAHQSTATPPGTLRGTGGDDESFLCTGCQVWARDLLSVPPSSSSLSPSSQSSSVMVALVNWGVGASAQDVTATWGMLGLPEGTPVQVRDLWTHQDWPEAVGADTSSITAEGVGPGGTVVLQLTPV
jgi:alpha-galactosidase